MDIIHTKTISVTKKSIQTAPHTTGVYIFRNKTNILYIGKSVNIKARLLSHWENARIDAKEAGIMRESNIIGYIITDSEFKALLLEAQLIQSYKPKYNVRWRDDKSSLYVKIPIADKYPMIQIIRKEDPDGVSQYFGPFSSRKSVEELLRHIRKIIPFCMQKRIGRHPCFYSKIGLCNPCPSYITYIKGKTERLFLTRLYRKQIRMVVRMFEGKTDEVFKTLYAQLKRYSDAQEYEKAIMTRNTIQKFEWLLQKQLFGEQIFDVYNQAPAALESLHTLLQPYFSALKPLHRIECFDISNLSQKEATASLVVLTDGHIDRSKYRKFKIKNLKLNSDFAMLTEVLSRRFRHNEWPEPDLLVVDGGKPQVRTVAAVLQHMKKTHIPLIGIAKHPDRFVINTMHYPMVRPAIHNLGYRLVQEIRDESHRFAKLYHTALRSKALFHNTRAGQ